jgi:hypothetical protein
MDMGVYSNILVNKVIHTYVLNIYSGVCIKPTLPLYVATYNLRVPFASLLVLLNCRMVNFEAPNFIRIRAYTRWGQVGTQFWTTPLEAWAPKTI